MITGAIPLFEHLPVAFADPVSLATQQAEGHLTLIVAAYPDGPPPIQDSRKDQRPTAERLTFQRTHASTPCYDVFVCKAPVVVTVAHVTPEFRFPISATRALQRFDQARRTSRSATLSLYEVDRPLAGRFLETVFFQECLKLCLRQGTGTLPADVVYGQIEQTGCRSGVLEINDFADPHRPLITLCEMSPPPERALDAFRIQEQTGALRGRVLVYDRARNRALAEDRGCETLDIEQVMRQAARFAEQRYKDSRSALAPITLVQEAMAKSGAGSRENVAVKASAKRQPEETLLTPATEDDTLMQRMAALLSGHPAGLLDERFDGHRLPPETRIAKAPETLQTRGDGYAGPLPERAVPKPTDPIQGNRPTLPEEEPDGRSQTPTTPPADVPVPEADEASAPELPAPSRRGEETISAPEAALHAALQAIVEGAREALTQHFGPDKADLLWQEAARQARLPLPVPAQQNLPFLRVLVTVRPPRRIMRFRRRMRLVQEALAADLHAVHGQFRHLGADHPLLLDLARLWSRCTYE